MAKEYFWDFAVASLTLVPFPMFYDTPWQNGENPYDFLFFQVGFSVCTLYYTMLFFYIITKVGRVVVK